MSPTFQIRHHREVINKAFTILIGSILFDRGLICDRLSPSRPWVPWFWSQKWIPVPNFKSNAIEIPCSQLGVRCWMNFDSAFSLLTFSWLTKSNVSPWKTSSSKLHALKIFYCSPRIHGLTGSNRSETFKIFSVQERSKVLKFHSVLVRACPQFLKIFRTRTNRVFSGDPCCGL